MNESQPEYKKKRGRKRSRSLQVGTEVYVNNELHVVAELLSNSDSSLDFSELNKPQISVYRVKGSTVLNRTTIYAGIDYKLKPDRIMTSCANEAY